MNKFAKGAVAAGAGLVLLLGGAGSLAYWNSSDDIDAGGGIGAGLLTIESEGDGEWSPDPADVVAVPGDVFTYTETLTLTGEGDNLWVTLGLGSFAIAPAVDDDPQDEALATALLGNASFEVDGAAYTGPIHLGTGTASVEVAVTITFPSASGNATQEGAVTFDDFSITATQVAPVP